MPTRQISVSSAPYDGHPVSSILDSLNRIGATYIEPAYIRGYTDPFDEEIFLPPRAREFRRNLETSGLGCIVMSAHMDLGLLGADEIFMRRMQFAAGIGARIIATVSAASDHADTFFRNMEVLLAEAERLNIIIALENPGDGHDSLFNIAVDGIALVERFRSPYLRLNYDAANTASHRPDFIDFAGDAVRALPASAHVHIKDVCRTEQGWHFTAIGDGIVNCSRILNALGEYPLLPISIELPLRFHRNLYGQPVRRSMFVPLGTIEATISRSLEYIRKHLSR